MRNLLIVLLYLTIFPNLRAGHLVGGEIFYTCLGDGSYVVTLKMYRDCNGDGAPFDNQVQIAAYRGDNNNLAGLFTIQHPGMIDTLPFNQNIPCLVDTPNICISTISYVDTIEIDVPIGGLSLVFQRCCRPPNVINIDNVAVIGSTYMAFIPDSTVAPCNSSPSYNSVPPTALCAGVYLNLDYSASDPDGDSLVYTFCRPYHGGTNSNPMPTPPEPPPFQTVPWAFGFNDQHQITALPVLEIGAASGQITGRPTQLGIYAFGVCVQEWRDGIFLSENKRDFQLTTAYCEVDAAAAIDSTLEECIGFDIQFFNQSTLGERFKWNFGDASTLDDTSGYTNPIYTFPDTGVYRITLIAFGEVCSDTTYLDYRVQHKIEPFFIPPPPDCLEGHKFRFVPEGFYKGTTKMRWEFENDTADISDDQTPVATKIYGSVGIYEVTLHYTDPELGCYKFYSDKVEIWPNPSMELIEPPDVQCPPYSGLFRVQASDAYRPDYAWYFDSLFVSDSSAATIVSYDTGKHDLRIILITDSMCIDTIDLAYPSHIIVLDTPQAGIEMPASIANMYTPDFKVYDASRKALSWEFYLDDGFLGRGDSCSFSVPDTGNYVVQQIAYHENGCADTVFKTVRVEPEYLCFIPNTFTPDGDALNDVWQPSVFVSNDYELLIYDRWGRVVFKSEDARKGWNGRKRNSGQDCPIGTYTYDLRILDNHDREWNYSGILNLLR